MAFPDFDTYVEAEHHGWGDPGDCTGCGRSASRLGQGVNGPGEGNQYCEWCLRESYGGDLAEYEFATTLAELLAPAKRGES